MPIPQSKRRFSRRDVVRGALGLGAGALALSACGSSSDDKPAGSTDSKVGGSSSPSVGSATPGNNAVLPKYIPYTHLKPDLPALDNGTSAYFAKYPPRPPSFGQKTPGSSKTVSGLTIMNTIPKDVESNPWWKAVNKLLGVDFKMIGSPIGEYGAKFLTTVAGNDLPDIACVLPSEVPGLPDLLRGEFQDLGEHLSGDAIGDYPGLANIPTYAWRSAVFHGSIYLIPIHRYALLRCYLMRGDLVRKAGLNPSPKSGDELLEIMRALTDKSKNRWSTASVRGMRDMVLSMTGTPNKWGVKDGVFTTYYETDEFKRGLALVAKMWSDGLIYPDAFSSNIATKIRGLFTNGTSGVFPTTPSWSGTAIAAKEADPTEEPVWFSAPKWDGDGLARNWLHAGSPYMVAVKQAKPDRIREILRIIDMLAAPWGTAENILIRNGVKGKDYTVTSTGTYTQTDKGKIDDLFPLRYNGSPAEVHFASDPEAAKNEYESEKAGMDNAEPHPTVGLDSPTDQEKGSSLSSKMMDVENDVIQGRKSMSDWDDAVRSWKQSGGDQIKKEYEASYAKVNS